MANLKLFVVVVIALSALASAQLIINAGGSNRKQIKNSFNFFKKEIGGPDNGSNPGPLKKGRRSINWDGPLPFKMPANFFTKTVPRGLLVKTATNKFRVSNPAPPPKDKRFDSINPIAAKDFQTFSSPRLFSPLDKTKLQLKFFIPGKNKKALVSAFGCVFVDVDINKKTFVAIYDKKGKLLKKVYAKRRPSGLTFVGIKYNDARIAKVVIQLGNQPLKGGKDHNNQDVVVLDDFLYGEPQVW